MDTEKLKQQLHRQIEYLNDEDSLLMLNEAASAYERLEKKDILDELSPEQLTRLELSIEQAKEGKTISHEDIKKKIREWLSR